MFIAHLPAGYLLTSAIEARTGDRSRAVLLTGLAASVLPDLDLLWFYLVGDRQNVHHAYLPHLPLFWIAVAALAWMAGRALRLPRAPLLIGVALANLLLHMVLDSIAAGIWWLRPFSDLEVNLVRVPAVQAWWVWNFVLHWTFALELAITAAALALWWRRHRAARRDLTA
ncbi:MAG TPA: metal-dependent hydrolase [Rubellimicrobium sp.]|nr:metal-dependent hydrolase [Rubellimicrobium sp.]